MIGFENVNSRIIAGSVNQYKTSVPEVTSEQVKKQPDKSALQNKQTKEKTEHARAMKGATILASIVVAGIAVTKFRGPVIRMIKGAAKKGGDINNSSARNNSGFVGNNNDPMTEIKSYTVDQLDKALFENERLKDRLCEMFPKITNIAKDNEKRQAERVVQILSTENKPLPFEDKRLFTSHEAEMIASYQDEYAYNAPLRLEKIKPESTIEIKTLDAMMEDAKPLSKPAVVYRGIVTQQDGKILDFAREFYAGNIVKDKAFVSTSRNAAETIANFGEQSGYVMRINLPQGTKGVDCRRFTMLDIPSGANAEFILPRNSEFRINSVDDNFKIIDADYLLQN